LGCPLIALNVFTGAVKEGPNVRIVSRTLHIGRDGRVRIRLACPAKLKRACRGRLGLREATRAARRLDSDRYRVRRGRRRAMTLRLGAPARRRVLRRRRVGVEAVERGRYGLKTTYGVRRVR
jgi:hypothetical protein